MFKKTLIVLLISIASRTAKAQYLKYNTSENSNQNNQEEPAQIVTGYAVNQLNNEVQRVKLKIKTVGSNVIITGVKELSSDYWTEFSTSHPYAEKIRFSSSDFEKQFEYKVYVPVLGKVVYF